MWERRWNQATRNLRRQLRGLLSFPASARRRRLCSRRDRFAWLAGVKHFLTKPKEHNDSKSQRAATLLKASLCGCTWRLGGLQHYHFGLQADKKSRSLLQLERQWAQSGMQPCELKHCENKSPAQTNMNIAEKEHKHQHAEGKTKALSCSLGSAVWTCWHPNSKYRGTPKACYFKVDLQTWTLGLDLVIYCVCVVLRVCMRCICVSW